MAGKSPVHLQLTTLPAELLLRVYEVLPSFIDALRLRATCHILHNVWTEHRTAIVNELVIDHFECYPYARQVLVRQRRRERIKRLRKSIWAVPGVDEMERYKRLKESVRADLGENEEEMNGGPPLDPSELCDRDLSRLVRNAGRVEEVIVNIEQKLVPELKIDGLPASKRNTIYQGNDAHPSTLTHTERLRVIRACYQIWSLTLWGDDAVRAKVFALRPRELFYLAEVGHWGRVTEFPTKDRWDLFQALKAAGTAVKKLYYDTYGCGAPEFQEMAYEGPVRLFVIWDHWQHNLKNLICRRPVANLQWDEKAEMLEYLWDYEPGDELLVAD